MHYAMVHKKHGNYKYGAIIIIIIYQLAVTSASMYGWINILIHANFQDVWIWII